MDIDLFSFVLFGLATWRITSLIVDEDGPFDMFVKFRSFIGVYYDEYSQAQGRNVVARAFTCFWCASIWVSVVVALLAGYYSTLLEFFVSVLALSALAIVVSEIVS